jgi:hypothetical protein
VKERAATQNFDNPPRRPLVQRVGAVLWPSFFAAAVANAVFFSIIDPLALRDISFVDFELSREAGYTIGFFMFWACTASASFFTWILLRPAARFNRPPGETQ